MDKVAEIAAFAQVVDAGGFSAAARQLGVTPSAVSKQVTHLEDRLGARLLHRTTRRLSLTEEGAAFYEHTKPILAALDEAEQAVSRLAAAPRGTLRVAMPLAFGQIHVAPILPQFAQRCPEVSVEIVTTQRYVNLVEEGIDVAIRIGDIPDQSMVIRKIAPNRRVVCASPGYLAQHGTPTQPADLAHHNCLTYLQQGPKVAWHFGEGDDATTVHVSGTIHTNSFTVLHAAVLAGIGITRIAAYVVGDDLRSGVLVALLTEMEANDGDVFAVYPAARHLSPKVRAFIDFLVETIGRPSYWERAGLTGGE